MIKFKAFLQKGKSFFFNAFNKLTNIKFGQTKEISISVATSLNEVKVSSVGYYHEWLIMKELFDRFSEMKTPFIVIFPQKDLISSKVLEAKQKYSVEIPKKQPADKDKFLDAVVRSENSAPNLAKKMIEDILSMEDVMFIEEIIVEHVGGVGLGKSGGEEGGKADIKISAKKMNEAKANAVINASIKIAIGGWITLLTTNSFGLVNKLFYPNEKWERGAKAINNLHANIKSIPELNKKYEAFVEAEKNRATLSKQKGLAKKNNDKDLVSTTEKEMIQYINKLGDFIYGDLFEYYYAKNKKEVNKNFLKALGLDQADSVYYTLVQEKTKSEPETHYYMSSKTSISYKELYGNLMEDFTISFGGSPRGEKSATRHIILKDAKGTVFWNSPIQFQQSGSGSWKLFMQDFQEIVKKHSETKKSY